MGVRLKIAPEWNIIKRIKTSIDEDPEISAEGKDFAEATKIAAIELVENAFKYTDPDPDQERPISFLIERNNGTFTISVTNYCDSAEARDYIKKTLDSLKTNDAFELYVERLQKIKDSPDGRSRLGFYRIAYETEYKLDYTMNGKEITITASRDV